MNDFVWGIIILFTLFITLLFTCSIIIYFHLYYKSTSFNEIKREIADYVNECNEFNKHIEDLKNHTTSIQSNYYGKITFINNNLGNYTYKRKALEIYKDRKNVYYCSATVLKNARERPFKYLCKYFNININEESLNKFENMLNDFLAVEQGKKLIISRKKEIINNISSRIPQMIINHDKKRLEKKLNFEEVDLSIAYYPTYSFIYISAGGNISRSCSITLDVNILEEFILYLANIMKMKKNIQRQRRLMTHELRKKIKVRDNFTCKCCGISIYQEPHLLLEIDHIIPLSKGGITTDDNLQTLCWKCNRSKGVKIV